MSADATVDAATTAGAVVRVQRGVVRDGIGIVQGCCPPALLGSLVARAVAVEGETISEAAAEPGEPIGQGCAAGEVPFRIRLPLRGLARPVREVLVASALRPIHPAYGAEFELSNLFYPDAASFTRSNVGRKRVLRQRDNETSMFMSGQMAAMFATELDPQTDEVRVLMTCAYGYRATDLMSLYDGQRVVSLVDAFDAQLRGLPSDDLVERRRGSLLNAQWHAATAAQDRDTFERALLGMLGGAEAMSRNKHAFVFHFNPVRSMCALAGYSILCGNWARAMEAFAGVRLVLPQAGRLMTFYPAHLQDFTKSCRLASNIEFFEEMLRDRAGEPPERLLSAPVVRLRGTLAETAALHLIRPSIRSDNPDDVLDVIRRFAGAA